MRFFWLAEFKECLSHAIVSLPIGRVEIDDNLSLLAYDVELALFCLHVAVVHAAGCFNDLKLLGFLSIRLNEFVVFPDLLDFRYRLPILGGCGIVVSSLKSIISKILEFGDDWVRIILWLRRGCRVGLLGLRVVHEAFCVLDVFWSDLIHTSLDVFVPHS